MCYNVVMTSNTFIFFGRSGCGKGTQAHLLQQKLEQVGGKVLYIETGAKFREFMEKGNHTSNLTKEVIANGGLLPAFLPVWVWSNFLIENFTGTEHLILDGLSRRAFEAPILDSMIGFYKRDRPYVILIDVSREWSKERLMGRKREDDTDEYIESRLNWYDRDVVPAIEYFRNHSGYHFVEVNGEKSIEEVNEEIVKKLGIF
ncbi:MAG: adenylate kinase [Patescibacteria group bacterium]|nr:adenylate kinase [Patescibacteria group bacterium]